MSPHQIKKQKTDVNSKEKSEKELEGFLFGDDGQDLWAKTGHELDQKEVDSDEEETASDSGEQGFFFDSGPVTFTLDAPIANDSDDEIDYEAEQEKEQQEESSSDETNSDDEEDQEDSDSGLGKETHVAWEDDDDKKLKISLTSSNITKKLRNDADEDVINGVEYTRRLRRQFNKIYPKPKWALLPSEVEAENKKRKALDSDDDEDDTQDDSDEDKLDDETRLDLLKSTMGILDKRGRFNTIPPTTIDILRLNNANRAAHTKKKVTCIAFHPNAQVLLTGGLDSTLRLFQIDGKINPKIQSVRFRSMPIYHAEFHPSGNQIIVSGRRSYFYIYDIQSGVIDKCPGIWGRDEKSLERFSISPCGRYIAFLGTNGTIIIVSYLTKKWFGDLRMNGHVESVSWSSDGKFVFGFNNQGEVYQFDVETKGCVKRWIDDGCIRASAICVSPNEKYYATGSSTGVVNIYDKAVLDPEITKPKPIKAIGNLTTTINNIVFNHDSQLMVITSKKKKDQLKIVNVKTGTVYANWPTDRTPLGRVTNVAFSPNSDYVAVANDTGSVLLYTLKHYALK